MPTRVDTRPSAAKRGYSAKWQKVRLGHLRSEPHCRPCKKAGRTVTARHVDHIVPHRGDMVLFWAKDNRQSLCDTCHSGDKQKAEHAGNTTVAYRGCSVDGSPLDPAHRWNAGAA